MNESHSLKIKSITDEVCFSLTAILASSYLLLKAHEITGVSRLFPTVVCWIMFGCGAIALIKSLIAWLRHEPFSVRHIDVSTFVYASYAALALVVTILLVPYIGFFSAITLLLIGTPLILKYRNVLTILLVTVGFEMMIYLVFVEAFSRRLPSGALFH
jgi:predicted Na+-dependent transporter